MNGAETNTAVMHNMPFVKACKFTFNGTVSIVVLNTQKRQTIG